MNWKSLLVLVAPFGAPVHLRKKAFDKAGPRRREQGLESKWLVGKYVGLSTIVHHGHLVYVEATTDEKEKFLHNYTCDLISLTLEYPPESLQLTQDQNQRGES